MNLKLPIEVTKKTVASIISYFESSGYTVTRKEQGEFVTYLTNAPGYEITPLIEQHGRKSWFFIRVPRVEVPL